MSAAPHVGAKLTFSEIPIDQTYSSSAGEGAAFAGALASGPMRNATWLSLAQAILVVQHRGVGDPDDRALW